MGGFTVRTGLRSPPGQVWRVPFDWMAVRVSKTSETCLLKIKVRPGASKTEIVGLSADGSVRVRLAAPPVRGKANRELITLLAGVFGMPASSVRIVRGLTSRQKSVLVKGIDRSRAEELLKGRLDQSH